MIRFEFTDPRQRATYSQLFRQVGQGPADFFLQACQIMARPEENAAATHMVGHCMREVESALRRVLLDRVQLAAEGLKRPEKDTQLWEIDRILGDLEVKDDPFRHVWETWGGKLHEFAHRDALKTRAVDDDFMRFWREFQELIAFILDRFEAKYLTVFSRLDNLLSKENPVGSDADEFVQGIPQTLVTWNYFFQRLKHPAWLQLLRTRGYFELLPSPVHNEEGITYHPDWPPGEYILKIAASEPDQVFELLKELPPSKNASVNSTLFHIACQLPLAQVSTLEHKLGHWLSGSPGFWRVEQLVALVERLLQGGHLQPALALANQVLALQEREAVDEGSPRPEPTALLDAWHYVELLRQLSDLFLGYNAGEWFGVHVNLLGQAIAISARPGMQPPVDNSIIWHPNIAHGNRMYLRSDIAASLCNTAFSLVERQLMSLEDVVVQLESQPWGIFSRIALYLIAQVPKKSYQLLRSRILNEVWVREKSGLMYTQVRPEFFQLIRAGFPLLKQEDKDIFVSWLEQGPDLESLQSRFDSGGQGLTLEEETKYINQWKRDRLSVIAPYLDDSRKENLDSYIGQDGKPVDLAQNHGIEFRWGPVSPKTEQELAKLTVGELVEYLKGWTPPPNPFEGPSIDGLGQQLSSIVKANPSRFSQEAHRFATPDLDPTYLRHLLFGFEQAIRASFQERNAHDGSLKGEWSSFNWEGILEVCHFVVSQPTAELSAEVSRYAYMIRMRDSGYKWSKVVVAELLQSGFFNGVTSIPIDHRTRVWQILEALTREPEPAEESEGQFGFWPSSIRGKAFQAVFLYAEWATQGLTTDRLVAVPEVKAILEAYLDIGKDPWYSIRSVYGQYLHTLFWLDPVWAGEIVGRALSDDDLQGWQATWESYILLKSPRESVLPVLAPHYAKAIDFLSNVGKRGDDGYLHNLAEHLLQIYLYSGEQYKWLWARFMESAPLDLRVYILQRAGAWVTHRGDDYSPEQVKLFQELLEERIQVARSNQEVAQELNETGYWFSGTMFGAEWLLTRITEILDINGWIEPAHLVAQCLAELSASYPFEAVGCLLQLVNGSPTPWQLRYFLESHGKKILTGALQSGNPRDRDKAEEVINRLAAKGYLGFSSILNPASNEADESYPED